METSAIEARSTQEAASGLWWIPIITGTLWILFSLLMFRFDYASVTAISISALTIAAADAMRANHFRSAGITYHGAHSVLVCDSISENARW